MNPAEKLEEQYAIDILADQAGGYFALPNEDELAYTDLLFSVCDQFGIRYYTATEKERCFVEEVTRLTWACQKGKTVGIDAEVRPSFTA